ncbi:hypothetical protein C0989_003974 [Termitomyces sp. Mn162]|nr:hypothetical protein C0989_003974 [Termitomyces sp. Mn162]
MGSDSPEPSSTMSATDATYSQICPTKLNAHWPSSIAPFDHTTGEFTKWSNKLEIFLQQSGLNKYIFAPESKPDCLITEPNASIEPIAHANWLANNDLIIGVIQAAISEAEQDGLKTDRSAKECYNALKARAQCKGLVKQVALICKALTTYAPVAKPIEATAWKICDLINRAFVIGSIDRDFLKCIVLLN